MKVMLNQPAISFGDNVRIRATPLTELELAGSVGQVYGETTPPVIGVGVIGGSREDYAINVFFDHRKESYWFVAELLKLTDSLSRCLYQSRGFLKTILSY